MPQVMKADLADASVTQALRPGRFEIPLIQPMTLRREEHPGIW